MSAEWVRAAHQPKLGPLPAWVIWPIPLLLLNFSIFNLLLTALFLGWAIYLNVKGRTAMWVVRKFKSQMRANQIQSRPAQYRRSISTDVAWDDFNFDDWRNAQTKKG